MLTSTPGPAVVYSEERIRERVAELARAIERDFDGRVPVLVGVLTGSFIFLADLCRALTLECEVDFIRVESYGDATVSSGSPRVTSGLKLELKGKPVILVDEIVDTGFTLKLLKAAIEEAGASEVKVCALVHKKAHRRVEVAVDYVGFELDDGFLVGYGLDAAERRRNLPAIYLLDEL